MRIKTTGFAIAAVFVSLAFGQSPTEPALDRVLSFTQPKNAQEFQEFATLIRTISNAQATATDNEQKKLTLHGSASQIAVAEWLFNELDRPAPALQTQDPITHEYKAGNDDVVRLFFVTHTDTVQAFQEIATLVRTIGNIRQVFTYNAPRAVAMRGTAGQMSLADALVKELDAPAQSQHTGALELSAPGPKPGSPDDVVRVFYIANATSAQEFQEMTTAVRTITDIRQVFTYNERRAVALRSPQDQMLIAEWLLQELDKPANAPPAASGPHQLQVPAKADDVVRVFYLPSTQSVQEFQQTATLIRSTTNIRQAFTYNPRRALALRGTLEQMAQAQLFVP